MTKEKLFKPIDQFMIRVPLLTLTDYSKLAKTADLEPLLIAYLQDPIIYEAISIASPTLIDSFNRRSELNSERKRRQLFSSLLKYLLRMSSRATPFGLFAAVGLGSLSDTTSLFNFHPEQLMKRARVDMEWLVGLVEELENNRLLMQQFKVMTNPLCYQKADRLSPLDYVRQGESSAQQITIRRSYLVDKILELTVEPITYNELEKEIFACYQDLDREKVSHLLWTLFQKRILISELSPALLTSSTFERLIQQLEASSYPQEKMILLKGVQTLLKRYNLSSLGESTDLLSQLIASQQQIYQAKQYLQIDSGIKGTLLHLNRSVADEV